MKLSLVETVAFAGIALYIGAGVRRLIPVLSRYNIPAPVIGGLLVATSLTAARSAGYTPLTFDTTLQSLMGKDYDSAVMGAGLCGFMLGTTANAVANMGALVQKYGPAPRAFLIVPMVGAFFIDFSNAVVITVFLNLLK